MVTFDSSGILDRIKGNHFHGGRISDLDHFHTCQVDLKIHVFLVYLVFSRLKRTGGGILYIYVHLISGNFCFPGRKRRKIMFQNKLDGKIHVGLEAFIRPMFSNLS